MKSTIVKLREKTKTYLAPKHFFFNYPQKDKQKYAAVILLQTQLSQEVSPIDHFELMRLFTFGLGFGKEDVLATIRYAQNREDILEWVLTFCNTRERQIVLFLDLYNASLVKNGYGEKESEAIAIYAELFHFPENYRILIRRFVASMGENALDQCMNIYSNMMQIGMESSLETLRYYIPEVDYMTVVDAEDVLPGKEILLKGRCELREELHIKKGCVLRIENAQMHLTAPIIIDGGTVCITDSELTNEGIYGGSLILVRENTEIFIKNTNFLCRNLCSAILQQKGTLTVEHCNFWDTNRKSAIWFHGEDIKVSNCHFKECFTNKEGAAISVQSGEGLIEECTFEKCYAQQGGAIFCVEPVCIVGCIFSGCHAHDLAHSILYQGSAQKYVRQIIYEDTMDERMELVQVVSSFDSFDIKPNKELWITYSIFITERVVIPAGVKIIIENANVYLSHTLCVVSGLVMNRCQVYPREFVDLDLIDVTNGSPVVLRDCRFDGGNYHGIIRATGTKLEVSHCLFTDVARGRAIYNSVDLLLKHSVFSNCVEGAVYGTRVMIKDCIFVNCRSDKGAGVYVAGNKGIIKECKFNRCIALVNGGGISTFGNYQISDCEFTECAPDNCG